MNESRYIQLGENLRRLRMEQGLSQRKLARMVNTSHSAYFNIEHGKSDVKLGTLFRLADALDVDIKELFS